MESIKIQNVVLSTHVDVVFPLTKIAESYEEAEYEPEAFPGLVIRLKDPNITALVFRSGTIVCVGSKTKKEAELGIAKIMKMIKKLGVKVPEKYETKIENIVAVGNLGYDLNLEKLAFSMEDSEYEPENFPGLICKLSDPKVSFLIFSSGSIVCVGGKKISDAKDGLVLIEKKLKKYADKKRK
ncbi:MAG: TATA-box-binding protein [Candidatus Aenigmatarchaeota archaeon]|nr:MAG: TATA-box-binding protein [Candidatus Aenigmarchaeota archaeon]